MRWSLKLQSPGLVAGSVAPDWDALKGEQCRLRLGPDTAGHAARVGVSLNGQTLEIGVVAEGLPDSGRRPDHAEWANRAYLAVLLNPSHDHGTRLLYAVDDRQEVVAEAHWAIPGEEIGDDGAAGMAAPPKAGGRFRYLDEHRFAARLCIPTTGWWAPPGAPVGLAVRVGFHEARIPDPLTWPDRVAWTGDSPLVFGDLHRSAPLLEVRELDIPKPVWGGDSSPITIRGSLSKGAPLSGVVRIRIVLPGDDEYVQDDVAWESAGRDVCIFVPMVFPFRAKWANGLKEIARLHLSVVGEDGQVLWYGGYPFGFDHGIIVRERFGVHGGTPHPRPAPGRLDFLDEYRRFVLTRIPDYHLRTTRDGAPSDFYLEDRDGEADLDLSAEGALDLAAAMIADRFPDWQDALCGAAMWVHHPCITRHSSTWSRISNAASIETIPRLAGCFCGDTTRLLAVLAGKIGKCLRVPLEGLSMGLRGHLGTLVETPVGEVVIDGMLGLWFHTLDNTRLATLDEMRASREIAERVWYAPRAHGHEFFYGVHNQLVRRFRSGPLVWPG